MAGQLDKDELCLSILVLDEWIHADDIHVVLFVMRQQVVVQLQRRDTLSIKAAVKFQLK